MNLVKKCLRNLLGILFMLYGLLNLFWMHPFSQPLEGDVNIVPDARLFWHFFGRSHAFVYYLGIVEITAGVLIAFPKTTRIGAFACAVLGANIAFLDFAYDVGPVRYWVSIYTLLSCVLIYLDWEYYQRALFALVAEPSRETLPK